MQANENSLSPQGCTVHPLTDVEKGYDAGGLKDVIYLQWVTKSNPKYIFITLSVAICLCLRGFPDGDRAGKSKRY
ncbi:hypothetical protein [Sodalis sp. dw_96]|uniref:hypothetical protein n=1 Tax=Sodalis sp. dw_96 TaxID=2719794 RepID=UPI001BD1E1BC|nr:hypothetical protein [Sodalis sp. dw_96]